MGSTPLSVWCRRPADGAMGTCLARRRKSNKCPLASKTLKPSGVVQTFIPAKQRFSSAGSFIRGIAAAGATHPPNGGRSALAAPEAREQPAEPVAAEARRLGLAGPHERHPVVERQRPFDQPRERRSHRRLHAGALD